jgi:hypothetical protein
VGDGVALRAVVGPPGADVDHGALGQDLDPTTLGEVEVVLDQGVLRAVAAADHARPAAHTPRAVRALTAEEGVGDRLAGLAEEHAHACLRIGAPEPVLLRVSLKQQVGGGVLVVRRHAQHPLRLVVGRAKLVLPARELGPLTIGVERGPGAVQGVGVAERPSPDAAS